MYGSCHHHLSLTCSAGSFCYSVAPSSCRRPLCSMLRSCSHPLLVYAHHFHHCRQNRWCFHVYHPTFFFELSTLFFPIANLMQLSPALLLEVLLLLPFLLVSLLQLSPLPSEVPCIFRKHADSNSFHMFSSGGHSRGPIGKSLGPPTLEYLQIASKTQLSTTCLCLGIRCSAMYLPLNN